MARKVDKDKEIQVVDFRYDEGIRGRKDSEISATLTTKSSGFSGLPMVASKTNWGGQSMNKLRIRKLVPVETIKLMGFERKDYQALRDIGQSDAQIYHECGDSIVVTCLMGIFGQMLPISEKDLQQKIENYVEEVKNA